MNGIENMHCTFCSYANGLIAYVREVVPVRKENWCPSDTLAHLGSASSGITSLSTPATLTAIEGNCRRCGRP